MLQKIAILLTICLLIVGCTDKSATDATSDSKTKDVTKNDVAKNDAAKNDVVAKNNVVDVAAKNNSDEPEIIELSENTNTKAEKATIVLAIEGMT